MIHFLAILVGLLLCLQTLRVHAETTAVPVPTLEAPAASGLPMIPAAPQIAASSYLLMEAETGEILVEHNSDQRLPPASLTKMMTAYALDYEIAQGHANLTDMIPISVQAWKTGGSKMFVREGTSVSLDELMRGIIIQSGNDASVAVAEFLAGSEDAFAAMMNQHATRLGMQNSNFVNATGLPADAHHSSARDLAKLARAIIRDFPQHYDIYAEKYFTYNNIRQPNRNLLLWRDKSVDGLKTGHTEEAGYCLVASAVRDGMRLISVVMGTRSEEARARETMKLLNFGFRYFETHLLYEQGESLLRTPVWSAVRDEIQVGTGRDIKLTIPRGQKDALQVNADIDQVVHGPVEIGQQLGELRITLGERTLLKEPIVALESVEEAGFFKKIWHQIVLFLKGFFE